MNIFDDMPDKLNAEVFESLVTSDNIKIERIISKGHSSPESGWYNQKQHEWIIVLKGEAKILFDTGSSVMLKAGDYLNIEAHQKHKVSWTVANTETIWLAIHY